MGNIDVQVCSYSQHQDHHFYIVGQPMRVSMSRVTPVIRDVLAMQLRKGPVTKSTSLRNRNATLSDPIDLVALRSLTIKISVLASTGLMSERRINFDVIYMRTGDRN